MQDRFFYQRGWMVATIQQVAQLREPLLESLIRWLPVTVKDNRALAVAYIEATTIMARLDDVVGADSWKTEYVVLNGTGCVECRLSIKIGPEWITKADVGSPSEQPAVGDKVKSAFRDALKRAATSWGIGRYLHYLPRVWADYDPQRKQLVTNPQLPAWALPKPAEKKAG